MKKILMVLLLVAAISRGEITLPNIFGDSMVLQRGQAVPVWGESAPGEKITVTFKGQTVQIVADDSGEWRIDLAPMDASAEGAVLTVQGEDNTISFSDVLVGDVWLCSGQSNMQFTMWMLKQPEEELLAATNFPFLRLFKVPHKTSPETPVKDVDSEWQLSTHDTAGAFSGTATYFGRALCRELGIPIGLINSSVGGTPAESWTPRNVLEQLPFMAEELQKKDQARNNYDPAAAQVDYEKKLAEWQAKKDAGEKTGRKPKLWNPYTSSWQPATLYNGMIAPLQPFSIRGVIWYQGESNAGRYAQYRELFSEMIFGWREAWGQGNFPFLFVQLANFMGLQSQPVQIQSTWAPLREAQEQTLALTNTAMAVITDVGDADDIHPRDKKTVGERLAVAAQAVAYGQDLVYSGPVFQGLEIHGHEAVVSFGHTGSGLMARGEELQGFAVRSKEGDWQWANARIEGNTVVVRSDSVDEPFAVRYNWANNPIGNLYNKEGFPASLFRSDK